MEINIESDDQKNIRGRRYILIYGIFMKQNHVFFQAFLQQAFNHSDLVLNQLHKGDNKTVIDFSFCKRHWISQSKWQKILMLYNLAPTICAYDKTYFDSCIRSTYSHFPERFQDSITKIQQGDMRLIDFLEKCPSKISSYASLKSNLAQVEADKQIHSTSQVLFKKKRGIWLHGNANVGKTTLAIKRFLQPKFYEKDTTTKTFDDYRGQSSILIDDLDESSAGNILPILKTIINVKPSRVNIKFGSIQINAKVVVITSQYRINEISKDSSLIAAIRARFKFYYVTADPSYTYYRQFNTIPGDRVQEKPKVLVRDEVKASSSSEENVDSNEVYQVPSFLPKSKNELKESLRQKEVIRERDEVSERDNQQ